MTTFKVGDRVTWGSQSSGCYREKTGTVVAVIPAGQAIPKTSKSPTPGMPRDHESYLVRVPKRGLYWPRVAHLSLAPEPTP